MKYQAEMIMNEEFENEMRQNEKKRQKLQERRRKVQNQQRLKQLKSFLDGQPLNENNLSNTNKMKKKIYFYASEFIDKNTGRKSLVFCGQN